LGDASAAQSLLDQITGALNDPLRWLAGVTGLGDAMLEAQYILQSTQDAIGGLGAAIGVFVNTGIGLMQSIGSLAQTAEGAFDDVSSAILNVGQNYGLAANNAFGALAATPGLTPVQLLPLQQMASLFGGCACLINNSFNALPLYATYDALMGASFCSSTAGGPPPSAYAPGDNPWADITPAVTPPVTVTPAANAAMLKLANGDPLLLVGQNGAIGTQMTTIGSGVQVAA
jgi:hypothetical protein